MLFDGIILTCCIQIKEERSVQSIYHLLKGKRAIQTVQDAHLYTLDKYFGIYKSLLKKDFDYQIKRLIQSKLLLMTSETTVIPTKQGIEWYNLNKSEIQQHNFNGLKYTSVDDVFIARLLLLIQVLTNSKMKHHSYIPIIDQSIIINWVKYYYSRIKHSVEPLLDDLYNDLHMILNTLPLLDAEIFVNRLTTYNHYGMSKNQLAIKYEMHIQDITLRLTSTSHHMLAIIQSKPKEWPALYQICSDLETSGFITISAYRTYELIQKGLTIQNIVNMRQLKLNTIYDHIVEISLYDPSFSIKSYVSEKEQEKILFAIKKTNTTKLKEIKSNAGDDISYFQIRLVLAIAKIQKKVI